MKISRASRAHAGRKPTPEPLPRAGGRRARLVGSSWHARRPKRMHGSRAGEAPRGARSPDGRVEARAPGLDLLERVERGQKAEIAVAIPGLLRAAARAVADELVVLDPAHVYLIHAAGQEVVLPPLLPRQDLHALVDVLLVLPHGGLGEDLHGPVHHGEVGAGPRVAVHDEEPAAVVVVVGVGLQPPPQPVRQEDGVGVGLDRPVVVPDGAVFEDHVPHLHEQQRVSRGAVLGHSDLDLWRLEGLPAGDCGDGVRKDPEAVAREDSGTLRPLVLHELELVGVHPEQREAKQRGVPHVGEPPAPRAKLLAAPGAVLLALVRAGRVLVVALVALLPSAGAARRAAAVLVVLGAHVLDPTADLAAGRLLD
mmetsp:Transcript_23290/g.65179  ORF Transcript_23290/g.65179 Transcript_23290/m.65179 type:complete len:367 (-) Transcript_23290:1165-2265(-)